MPNSSDALISVTLLWSLLYAHAVTVRRQLHAVMNHYDYDHHHHHKAESNIIRYITAWTLLTAMTRLEIPLTMVVIMTAI